ncbi:MAG: hypothetical protein R3B07_35730 [Polyangiaceae bacterium]
MAGTTYTVNLIDGVSGEAKKVSRSLGEITRATQQMQGIAKAFNQPFRAQRWRRPIQELTPDVDRARQSLGELLSGATSLGGPLGNAAGKVSGLGESLTGLGAAAGPLALAAAGVAAIGAAAVGAAMAVGALLKAADETSGLYRTALITARAWGKTGEAVDDFANDTVDAFLRVQRQTLGATDEIKERFGKMGANRIGGKLSEDLVRVATNMQALTGEGDEWIDKIVDMRNETRQGVASGQGAKVSDAFFEDVGGKLGSVQELWTEWSKVTGKSVDELKALQKTSKVTLADADALAQAAANLGKKFDGASLAGKSFGEVVSGGIHNLVQEAGTMVNIDRFTQPLGELLRSDQAVKFARMVGSAFDSLLDYVEEFVTGFQKGFGVFKGPLKGALKGLVSAFRDLRSALGGDEGGGGLGESFGAGMAVVATSTVKAVTAIIRFGLAVGAAIGRAQTKFLEFDAQVHSVIDPIADFMNHAGARIGQGLANGIDAGIDAAVEAAKRLASRVKAIIPDQFQIQSPSRFMMEMGGYMTTGFAEGITGGSRDVEQATKGTFNPARVQSNLTKNFSAIRSGGNSASIVIHIEGGNAKETAREVRLELTQYFETLGFEFGAPIGP